MGICGLSPYGRHKCRGVEFVNLKPMEKRLPDFRILHHTPRAHKTGDIKRLRRRTECDGHSSGILSTRGKRIMFPAGKHQVAVDFIGNDQNPIFTTQNPDFLQCLPAPLQTDRIVRITKNHHLRAFCGENPLQILQIHLIILAVPTQRVGNQLSLIPFDNHLERMVNRRLDNNLIACFGEEIDGECDAFHNTGHICQLLPFHLEAVTAVKPVDYRAPVCVGRAGIAINRMRNPLLQRCGYLSADLEVHVGNPQRCQVVFPEKHTQIVDFRTTASMPVNHFIKIILFHISHR